MFYDKKYDKTQKFNCGVKLSQDEYGITTELVLTGKTRRVRPNRPEVFDSKERSIYISCFYPTIDIEMDPITSLPKVLPTDVAQMWDREYTGFEFDGNDLRVKKYGALQANFTVRDCPPEPII